MLNSYYFFLFSPIFCIFGDVFNYQTRCKDNTQMRIIQIFFKKNAQMRTELLNMDINSRFQEVIDTLFDGKQNAFAKAIGVAPSVIANVVGARKGKPSFDVLYKICANANISEEWLLSGKGNMKKNAQNASKKEKTVKPFLLLMDYQAI